MRIVQVVNGLPPEYLGGTETYAATLAQEVGAAGSRRLGFLHAGEDSTQPEYALETTTVENVEISRINNTQRGSMSFADSYRNDTIATCFGEVLDRFQPDIVHFQHLIYLSTTCVHEAVRRRIPVVMTLHDYWLICQRGRFLKPDLSGLSRSDRHRLRPVFSPFARHKDGGPVPLAETPPGSAVLAERAGAALVR